MDSQHKYCWLDINTGEFSNSWNEKDQKWVDQDTQDNAAKNGWKLIKYECINDPAFQFYNQMKLK